MALHCRNGGSQTPDCWLKLAQNTHIPTNRPQLLATFLGKITRNLSFNRYKREHADKRGGSEIPAILDELSECVSGRQSVEEEIQYKELVRTLNEFLDSLPEHKRNIFVRRYWYSECVATIAKTYGMRENAVSMLLGRLRLRLQQYLTERGMQYDK